MYMVIDLETTVRSTIGSKASPHYSHNMPVACEYHIYDEADVMVGTTTWHLSDESWDFPETVRRINQDILDFKVKMIVGHNIRFDRAYLEKNGLIDNGVLWWDTMIGEYLLSAQAKMFPSLDYICKELDFPTKPPIVKEMWDNGVQTEDIDKAILLDYLSHDVRSTTKIFQNQYEIFQTSDSLPFACMEMEAASVTYEMEMNGLRIDTRELENHRKEVWSRLADVVDQTRSLVLLQGFPVQVDEQFDLESKHWISKVLFGGYFEYVEQVKAGVYKTGDKKGQAKYKNETKTIFIKGFANPINWNLTKAKGAKQDIYLVNDETLTRISNALLPSSIVNKFINYILEYRKLSKEYNTYIKNIENSVYPDGYIHGNINHCSTITGRLSSSNPNLQNFSNRKDL